MDNILNVVGGFLFSIGSASGILYAITKWYGNVIADKLSQKYAHQLSEELEKYKTILNRKLYINQKHFDMFVNAIAGNRRIHSLIWNDGNLQEGYRIDKLKDEKGIIRAAFIKQEP